MEQLDCHAVDSSLPAVTTAPGSVDSRQPTAGYAGVIRLAAPVAGWWFDLDEVDEVDDATGSLEAVRKSLGKYAHGSKTPRRNRAS